MMSNKDSKAESAAPAAKKPAAKKTAAKKPAAAKKPVKALTFQGREVQIIAESKSRKGQGIVKIKTTGTNQKDEVICTFLRQILIPGRGNAVEDKVEQY